MRLKDGIVLELIVGSVGANSSYGGQTNPHCKQRMMVVWCWLDRHHWNRLKVCVGSPDGNGSG